MRELTIGSFERNLFTTTPMIRTAWRDNPDIARIEVFDKYHHDEGWAVTGRVTYRWQVGSHCTVEFEAIPDFGEERDATIRRIIGELGECCVYWADSSLWVTRDLSSFRKLNPACFSLLSHYARLEGKLYDLAIDPSYHMNEQQFFWWLIRRFGGFRKRMQDNWMGMMV